MKILLVESLYKWINLPYTILLGLFLVYWITVIIGLLDVEFIDFDLEGDSFFGGLLNVGKVPFSIWMTVFAFQGWLYSVLINLWLNSFPKFPITGFFRFLGIAVVIVPLSAFLTKIFTKPLEKLFHEDSITKNDFVGQECEVTSSVVDEKFGIGEIRIDGDVQILDLRAKAEESFVKGEKALIFEYDDKEDVFWIARI